MRKYIDNKVVCLDDKWADAFFHDSFSKRDGMAGMCNILYAVIILSDIIFSWDNILNILCKILCILLMGCWCLCKSQRKRLLHHSLGIFLGIFSILLTKRYSRTKIHFRIENFWIPCIMRSIQSVFNYFIAHEKKVTISYKHHKSDHPNDWRIN